MVAPAAAPKAIPVTVLVLVGVLGALKLVLVGICLAIGFSLGNVIISKLSNAATAKYYAWQERKHDEPPEEDHDNGGLCDDAESEEAGS